MKKMIKIPMMLMALVFLFSGCEDDVTTSELVLDLSQTGSVEVHLFALLNRQQLGLESVPNGTKVQFSINYSQFNPNASTGRWTYMGEVNNGRVVIDSVPSTDSGVSLLITPEAFVFDQVQPFAAPSQTLPKLYQTGPVTVTVFPGQKTFREINYSFTDIGTPAQTVSRAWRGTSIFNLITGDETFIPAGITVNMHNDNWAATATVGQNGTFSANVPYSESFVMRFTATMTVPDNEGNAVGRTYRYTAFVGPYFEDSPLAQPVSFSFELWE